MSEILDERYLYTVNPKRVIRNLNENIPMLRISKSLYLTKEEVLKCLDFGSVYRRFSNYGKLEKVTKYDIDRVHRSNYISVEDWKKIQEKSGNVENLNVNGNEEVKPELGRGKTKPIVYYLNEEEEVGPVEVNVEEAVKDKTEELPVETSGYVAEVKDEPEDLNVTTTVYPDDGTTATIYMSENNDSKEEVAFINDSVEDNEEINESEEDDDVEEDNIEASEEESKSEQRVVVNYNGGKKKKHKH